jgi:hypothetical protein
MTSTSMESLREKACDTDGMTYLQVIHYARIALHYAQAEMEKAGRVEGYDKVPHFEKAEEYSRFAADMLASRRHSR